MFWNLFSFAKVCTPSHHVHAKIKKCLPHLISRGAKIEKITDTHLLVQDIDEWLWKDAQTLEHVCKYQIITHIYAAASSNSDNLNGLVVSIQMIERSRRWFLFESLLSVCICVVFFLWVKYVYIQHYVSEHGTVP